MPNRVLQHEVFKPTSLGASHEERRARALLRAEIIKNELGYISEVWNTNTISTDLKRNVILQSGIRAFATRVLPLTAFCTRLDGIKLAGTDKVIVPYFALDSTASHDFVAADGYNTFGNTNADAKTITVDKRKYQGLLWTSSELDRQPYLDVAMSTALKAEKLALDVVTDVLGIVTAENFSAAVKTEPAGAFDSDDVIDLKGVADAANWPATGRSMLLNSQYDLNLLKDSSVKLASFFGSTEPIREGLVRRICGFDYFADSRIPNNSESLEGFICWRSAVLVAFSPVGPSPEVRAALSRYEVVVEPTTGATLEYRAWGDPGMDTSKQIVECNYGFAVGEAAALKRLTSA